jgi:nicotinate-nucleotide--dimethylbenzimidazole phosphoribosyltransferase
LNSERPAPALDLTVAPAGDALTAELRRKIDNKTKPRGALGKLESLALQIGRIQQSLTPGLNAPRALVFAADHGLARAGVSAYPPEVTAQMVINFLEGGAAINCFCRLNGIDLRVIDAGVNGELPRHPQLVDARIGPGTADMLEGPAMSDDQCRRALDAGMRQVDEAAADGCNVILAGEMGIGNTSAAALLMHALTGLPLERCVGRGAGADDAALARKLAVLRQVAESHTVDRDAPLAVLAAFGGFEIAMMTGAFIRAVQRRMVILVDGFIATVAALVAARLAPAMLDYCVFSHCSGEQGHRALLQVLEVEPLVDLRMRLGEGTGAAVAYPVVQAAVAFINEMASFDDAGVSRERS